MVGVAKVGGIGYGGSVLLQNQYYWGFIWNRVDAYCVECVWMCALDGVERIQNMPDALLRFRKKIELWE